MADEDGPFDFPEILTESMVAVADHEPFVVIKWGEMAGQFTLQEAREFALTVMTAAEAAEHDSSLMRFLEEETGLSPQASGQVLGSLRVHRGSHRG